jgi:hypothetical protein
MGRAGLGRAFAHSGFNLSSFSIISFRSAVNLRSAPPDRTAIGTFVCIGTLCVVCNFVRPLAIEMEKRSTH